MIAMLLAAQITATALPQGLPLETIPPPRGGITRIVPTKENGLIRILPRLNSECPGAGRLEASLAEPTALYRPGDRPAVTLRKWIDYPDGRGCLVEAAP